MTIVAMVVVGVLIIISILTPTQSSHGRPKTAREIRREFKQAELERIELYAMPLAELKEKERVAGEWWNEGPNQQYERERLYNVIRHRELIAKGQVSNSYGRYPTEKELIAGYKRWVAEKARIEKFIADSNARDAAALAKTKAALEPAAVRWASK